MALRALLGVAVAFRAAPVGGSVAYPGDNDRSRFRSNGAVFGAVWEMPNLLNGKATRSLASDMVLHSVEATAQPAWVDHLYPFDWEKAFRGEWFCAHCRRWWWMSYFASSCYLAGLWIGTSCMKDKPPYELRALLAMWNLFLAVFSLLGMLRTVPHLLALLNNFGFEYTVCRAALPSYGNGATGLWVLMFLYSKYFELLDTVFLVARKRKVGFLHWYHHCSVLLYCWHAFVWEMPTGIYFIAMNYSVHAIMYFYYFLAATCKRPPKWGLFVTILQLLQMAVGIVITLSHLHILVYGAAQNCDGHIPNLTAALGMYASYFVLFAQFLFGRYCQKRDSSSSHKLASKKLE